MINEDNIFIGIDVSKDNLDIYFNSKHYQIKNNAKAISNYIKTNITSFKDPIKLCALESTGGYENLAMKLLQRSGIKVHKAHPNRVYAFAKASGHFAKTDKLDAKLLAKYAAFVADKEQGDEILSEEQEELKSLKAIEIDLQTNIAANKNRLGHLQGKALSYLKKQITFCERQLEQIRLDIDKLIENDEDLSKKRTIITSYKGVGKRVSSILLINLSELGKLNNKQIASLVGLARRKLAKAAKRSLKPIYQVVGLLCDMLFICPH